MRLRQALLQRAGWQAVPEGLFIARTRHVQALQRTREHLQRARHWPPAPRRWSCWPRNCAWRTTRWARSPAQFTADDLLGEIFGRFCIGKFQ
jgi:tRNA modification GTPase